MDFNTLEIETERLILKTLDESYANKVLDFNIKNKEFLKPWEPIRNKDYFTYKGQKELLKNDYEEMKEKRMIRLYIFKKNNISEAVIGIISINNIVRGAFLSCIIGYKMDKDEINKGYMTEALKGVIELVFDDLNLHRIEANIIPDNKPSLKIVNKLDFKKEGLAKKYLKINGRWRDHYHMVVLNEKIE